MDPQERYSGCLLGLAAGDAVGTTVEFRRPGTFEPLTDMIGGGPFGLKPGEWTDDTSMALCLAESLIEQGGFDPVDQLERYVRWYRQGHLSSTGECFDIGNTIRQALERFEMHRDPASGSTHPRSAANGSLMRLAPVPLFFATDPRVAVEMSGLSSKTTHALPVCIDACRYFGGLLMGAVNGLDKESLLGERYACEPISWDEEPLVPEIDEVAAGSFKRKEPPEIKGSGYVVHSLEAALWAFYKSDSFQDGCLMVVNLGDDADTTGAIFGQLAGAYYGREGIPLSWRSRLALRDRIDSLARLLYERRPR